jgi:YHS domain-containing protein
LDEVECEQLARRCLQADTAAEVRSLVGRSPAGSRSAAPVDRGQVVDPVCGMVVQIGGNPYALRLKATTHYFCSRGCMDSFFSQRSSP